MSDDNVRERILREATRLFARSGYGSTSVRSVVEAAGVTKPALYYYFRNKDDLFQQIVAAHFDRVSEVIDAAMAAGPTLRARLRALVQGIMDDMEREPDRVRFLMTAHHRPERDQPQVDLMILHLRKIAPIQQMFAEAVAAGEIRTDIPIETLSMAFIGLMNLQLMAHIRQTGRAVDVDALIEVFFHGAAA